MNLTFTRLQITTCQILIFAINLIYFAYFTTSYTRHELKPCKKQKRRSKKSVKQISNSVDRGNLPWQALSTLMTLAPRSNHLNLIIINLILAHTEIQVKNSRCLERQVCHITVWLSTRNCVTITQFFAKVLNFTYFFAFLFQVATLRC